jgi:hypothetical protein
MPEWTTEIAADSLIVLTLPAWGLLILVWLLIKAWGESPYDEWGECPMTFLPGAKCS